MHFVAQFLEHYVQANYATLKHQLDLNGPEKIKEWAAREKMVHAHLGREPFDLILELAEEHPTIVPLRDPILSLITWRHRNPNAVDPAPFIVQGWTDLLRLDKKARPLYVPVDITKGYSDRNVLLLSILYKVGNIKPDRNMVKDWAVRWPAPTSQGTYPLKSLYRDKDIKALEKRLGDDLKALRRIRGLKRFLKRRGYPPVIW